jgi:hypothetical protein
MNDGEIDGGSPARRDWSPLVVVQTLCLLVFTGFGCFVLYRMGQAAKAMGAAAATLAARADRIGARVEEVAGSAAAVGKSVEQLAGSVEKLAEKVEAANQAARALKRREGPLPPEEQKLIAELLRSVRASGLKFARGGKEYGGLTAYAWLWAKYKILESTVGSADDFVAKIGTKELIGEAYEVVRADGTKQPLAEWLRAKLAELRKKPED